MSATLWLALAFSSNASAAPGEACTACHAGIVQAFRSNGMGRSIQVRPAASPGTFYHRKSNRHYTVDGGTLKRYQVDAGDREINVITKPIDVALGSGRHAVTYLSRTAQGRLIELPLTWYGDRNGWAMSPGYDRADHADLRREVSDSCLFCHSSGPEPAQIDCARCHGSVQAHLSKPEKGTILNPRTLVAQRQLEICLQCHLETASRGIQEYLLQPSRTLWSFRPGEALTGYKMYFDRADSAGTDRFEFNHAGYRLLSSACFQKSEGRMTCTTCHDPHTAKVRADACSQCHPSAHDGQRPLCASCHMPRRTPADAIHTTAVDHKIAKTPKFQDPRTEDDAPYTGPVVPFYGQADGLSLALANVRSTSPETIALYRRHLERDPSSVGTLVALGKAYLRLNAARDAIPVLRKATRLDPMNSEARAHLGVALAVLGKDDEALLQLRRAVTDNPDHALSWINLGATLAAAGDTAAAIEAYSEAIRLQPDSSDARYRRSQLQSGR